MGDDGWMQMTQRSQDRVLDAALDTALSGMKTDGALATLLLAREVRELRLSLERAGNAWPRDARTRGEVG